MEISQELSQEENTLGRKNAMTTDAYWPKNYLCQNFRAMNDMIINWLWFIIHAECLSQ